MNLREERLEVKILKLVSNDSQLCVAKVRYAIGILDREKWTVKLLPAPLMHMQRSIKALKSKAAKAAPVTSAKVILCHGSS